VDDAHTQRPSAGQALAGTATAEGVWAGPVPAPVPKADPGAPPARPGRRIGLFRWVVVAGAALFAFGAYAQTSPQDGPLVDLTVLSERPDGSCTASWTDPLDSGLRTGQFHCDPNRDPGLKSREAGGSSGGNGFEIGRVASHGLWKGRLYRPDEFGPDGAAYQVVVGGEYFGLPLAGAGLVAGAVSVIRRRRETLPVPGGCPAHRPATFLIRPACRRTRRPREGEATSARSEACRPSRLTPWPPAGS
jgi:hypothetical protein